MTEKKESFWERKNLPWWSFPLFPIFLAVKLIKQIGSILIRIGACLNYMRHRTQTVHQGRFYPAGEGPDMALWSEVLSEWGLTEKDIPIKVREHKSRIFCFSIILVIGIISLYKLDGWIAMYMFSIFSITGLLYIITSLWRLNMYKKQRFIPLVRWIINPFHP